VVAAVSGEAVLGYLILCLGLLIGVYYYLVFDTSVPESAHEFGGSRIVNSGLANDRLVGALAALGLIVSGGVMVISGRLREANCHLGHLRAELPGNA